MLRGDGCTLPPAAIKEVEMGTAAARGAPGSPGASAAARGVPGLALGSLSGGGGLASQPGGALATHLGATQMHGDSADGKPTPTPDPNPSPSPNPNPSPSPHPSPHPNPTLPTPTPTPNPYP